MAGLARCWQMCGWRLPPSRNVLPRNWMRQESLFSRAADRGHTGRSQDLPSRLISRRLCDAASTREPGNLAKLARADAGVVAEEASEVRRLGKAQPGADVADARRLIEYRVDRLFHAHHVQVDLRRYPDRGFE